MDLEGFSHHSNTVFSQPYRQMQPRRRVELHFLFLKSSLFIIKALPRAPQPVNLGIKHSLEGLP